MKQVKRMLGLVWMIAGPLVIFFLMYAAYKNIELEGKSDINKPIPWVIIITIFTPIAAGLSIFGWYAWKGEYDEAAKG
jgi:uncharacterized Tic20 family protein